MYRHSTPEYAGNRIIFKWMKISFWQMKLTQRANTLLMLKQRFATSKAYSGKQECEKIGYQNNKKYKNKKPKINRAIDEILASESPINIAVQPLFIPWLFNKFIKLFIL